MGTDVDTVGQPAYNKDVGTKLAQLTNETANKVMPVGGDMTSANDIDYVLLVEVGRA